MKVIIEGKLYDTITSTMLYAEGETSLFKTQNGSYFMVDHEGVHPVSASEVKKYLGIRDTELYITEFGEVEEA